MNKKMMLLICSLVGLLFISCDWNYSKSPEVPNYNTPEGREPIYSEFSYNFIVTDENDDIYYKDSTGNTYNLKGIYPSCIVMTEVPPSINISNIKIKKVQLFIYNPVQWENGIEIKPEFDDEYTLIDCGSKCNDENIDGTQFFTYNGITDNLGLHFYLGEPVYTTYRGFLFDLNLDKVRETFIYNSDETSRLYIEFTGKINNTEIRSGHPNKNASCSPCFNYDYFNALLN